jgi:hypothetical protein
MLIKSADDKSKRLALLEDLQNSPVLDAWQKTNCVKRRHGTTVFVQLRWRETE